MSHEELQALLPAYALDAATAEEVRDVETHLSTCSLCQRELTALHVVTGKLASAVEGYAPQPFLREQILAAIQREPREVSLLARWGIALASAAAVLVVVLAGAAYMLGRQVATLSARVAAQEQVLALLAAPSARSTALTGAVPAGARFIYDPPRSQGVLLVTDLQDPGRELVYQLWLIAGTQPESAGVFRPVPGQPVVLPVAADFARYQAVAISIERGPSGAPQPTSTPILVGKI